MDDGHSNSVNSQHARMTNDHLIIPEIVSFIIHIEIIP